MNFWKTGKYILRPNPVAFLNPVALIPMALETSMQNPCNPCEQKLWRNFPVGIEELVGRLGSLLLVKLLGFKASGVASGRAFPVHVTTKCDLALTC